MMKFFLTLITALFMQFGIAQNTSTTLYFIRHAEKVDNSLNPDLSEVGLKRAENWSKIFSAIRFDEIYSTNYKRTIETATPTAEKNKISIKIYDHKTIDIASFIKENSGKNVLLVGHSNTIPNLVNQIIGEKVYPDIEDTTFGNLYIVTISNTSVTHQLLKLP
ncbi:histidine phosphatase family protein [Flavobacterium sp. SM15]|uniref:SixA phosphatase family protein n=1 Tax=Flavobacterium sp. SM15 TaxID=2908005 RepID=UPI001EDB3786|nr:phosphoglycerate mutase family protein [Flavobacterium sp. SM15]MCG2612060.1 histidine phosphatase family protein [Flavobacterium sp. SM15]